MLYMIIEHFADGDPGPVYHRFRERGRLAPDGLEYRGSWVTSDLTRCYQLMECDDRALLDRWMWAWDDLVRFDVVEVVTSAEAAEAVDRDPDRRQARRAGPSLEGVEPGRDDSRWTRDQEA